MPISLYSAGFNAWFQLSNFLPTDSQPAPVAPSEEPDDINTFTKILTCNKIAELRAYMTCTVAKIDGELRIAGSCTPEFKRLMVELPGKYGITNTAMCADERVVVSTSTSLHVFPSPRNAITALSSLSSSSFSSLSPHPSSESPSSKSHPLPSPPAQLLAHNGGFIVLLSPSSPSATATSSPSSSSSSSSTTTVLTSTDPRYPSLRGYDNNTAPPLSSSSLTPIPSLQDLPTGNITKISTSGYVCGALTAGGDLYVWGGGHPSAYHSYLLSALCGVPAVAEPVPVVVAVAAGRREGVDVEEGTEEDNKGREDEGEDGEREREKEKEIIKEEEEKDIACFGVGEAHMIVLTTTGEVYVIGSNRNGQLGLGLGMGDDEGVKKWTRVNLNLSKERNEKVVGVVAGPRCSFIVVEREG